MTALATFLDKYPDVGHQAKIYVDPDATPKYCKARPVPYAMHSKLAEPEHLKNEGIIKPVHFADWVAPIVPILKSDKKSVRICGNFKLSQQSLSARQVPDTEERGPFCQNGWRTKVHQAGPLPELEEESRKYVVINTHRGLFEYTRLPFGASSAPGTFQWVMESLLRGITNVVVYLDDILITGPDDETHLAMLGAVLKRLSAAGLRARKEICVFLALQLFISVIRSIGKVYTQYLKKSKLSKRHHALQMCLS